MKELEFKIKIPEGYTIDEEKSSFTKIVFKPIERIWVDLGLPSGNLWCDANEEGYYNWNDAVEKFGESMPRLTDFVELYDYCKLECSGDKKGMIITGPNGNSIFLPASGYSSRDDGRLFGVDNEGCYWSASPYKGDAHSLYFSIFGDVDLFNFDYLHHKLSIRLIKRK